MCGRYYIEKDDSEYILRTLNHGPLAHSVKTSGEIRPTDTAAVLCPDREGHPKLFAVKWGFTRSEGGTVINTRSERLSQLDTVRRCLIPFSGYYEWEKRGRNRVRCAITPGSGYALAGVYRKEANGVCFSVLTREAAPGIRFIHDRMPMILPLASAEAWLDPNNRAAIGMTEQAYTDVSWRYTDQLTMDSLFTGKE